MKYKIFLLIFILNSCSVNSTKFENRSTYSSKGFAYIYNDEDYQKKTINGKLDNSQLQASHKDLKINSLIKIINPVTKESITVKNVKRIDYPDFYKILITPKIAEKLNIQNDLPLVEIIEIKKNKSFVAKKAKIFNEEKKISSNAPVTSVKISNISKNPTLKNKLTKKKFFILIGSFYSKETADFLKKRITLEIPAYDTNKLKVVKKSNKEIQLLSGPYITINLMKNDYSKLKKLGFEDLDITTND